MFSVLFIKDKKTSPFTVSYIFLYMHSACVYTCFCVYVCPSIQMFFFSFFLTSCKFIWHSSLLPSAHPSSHHLSHLSIYLAIYLSIHPSIYSKFLSNFQFIFIIILKILCHVCYLGLTDFKLKK